MLNSTKSLRVRYDFCLFRTGFFFQLEGNNGSRKMMEEHPKLPVPFSEEFFALCLDRFALSPSPIIFYLLSQIRQHRTFLRIIFVHIRLSIIAILSVFIGCISIVLN